MDDTFEAELADIDGAAGLLLTTGDDQSIASSVSAEEDEADAGESDRAQRVARKRADREDKRAARRARARAARQMAMRAEPPLRTLLRACRLEAHEAKLTECVRRSLSSRVRQTPSPRPSIPSPPIWVCSRD